LNKLNRIAIRIGVAGGVLIAVEGEPIQCEFDMDRFKPEIEVPVADCAPAPFRQP
jgi:hypothetical protein